MSPANGIKTWSVMQQRNQCAPAPHIASHNNNVIIKSIYTQSIYRVKYMRLLKYQVIEKLIKNAYNKRSYNIRLGPLNGFRCIQAYEAYTLQAIEAIIICYRYLYQLGLFEASQSDNGIQLNIDLSSRSHLRIRTDFVVSMLT